MRSFLSGFWRDESGLETVEMVILLVVLVSIAFAFRKTLVNWFNGFIQDTQSQAKDFGTPVTGTKIE